MAKLLSYNLQSVVGKENKAFEHDDPHPKLGEVTEASNGTRITSTVVEGLVGDDREQWEKPIEFLLSCVALSVGLGNIWRFPFVAYENGGGAFLIPYLIVLFLIGKPLYFLELTIGQFSSKGQVKVWQLSPIFKGVGYGSAFGTACVVSFYCVLMSLTVFYFFASFATNLPWTQCNTAWENVTCSEDLLSATNSTGHNLTIPALYFSRDVLQEKHQIDDGIGLPQWKLALCLLGSWLVILLTLIKGVKSAGKVAYFTALFPYFVLIILLIRGVTLPGAMNGIFYLFNPQWEKLLTAKVWFEAVGQCFFSLSTGFGPIIMFGSYNPFKHNIYRDAMIISFMDTFTSLLAGVTIFSILGNLAYKLDVDIPEVAKSSGAGLAFVSYPQAIAQFDWVPQFFAVLFFLMLFTLGVGSATSLISGIITIIHDQFPNVQKKWITIAVCVVGFCTGLPYITPGGRWILTLVDHFGGTLIIYVMATLEIFGIAWVYGLTNISRDINFMLGIKVSMYWKFCWGFFIPVMLSIILVYSLFSNANPTHDDQQFPFIALVFGWLLVAIAVLLLPICAIHTILKKDASTLKEKIIASIKPAADWGPSRESDRAEWLALDPPGTRFLTSVKSAMQNLRFSQKIK